MEQQNNLEKINILVEHAKANINLCVAAYQIIEKSGIEERPILMESFIRGYKYSKTDEKLDIPEVFNSDAESVYFYRYYIMVDAYLDVLLKSGLSKSDFYTELTNFIMTDKRLLDDGARAFAIFNCCNNQYLPYAQVDLSMGIKMTQEEYDNYLEQLDENIERINFILNVTNLNKTERVSLLIREIDDCDDFKLKTILLVNILNRCEEFAAKKALLQFKNSSNSVTTDT